MLRDAGVGSPEYDAAELLAHVVGVQRGLLAMAPDLSTRQAQQYADLIRRRCRREPLQHIIGAAGFYGLDIEVGPGVFIPRPETELLVESALRAIAPVKEPVVIDLCSGSGAIPIAIAHARPTCQVCAVELSAQAAEWLRRNVDRLAPSVRVIEGDALDARLPLPAGADLVTCNPPYVPAATAVEAEVGEHDPHAAVFGGADGLDLIRPLVPRIAALLRPGGTAILEHDQTHQGDVIALFDESGQYADISGLDDLAGRARFVRAVRR